MLNKLEKKFGRFAIPNLMNYIIGCYAIGYVMSLFGQGQALSMLQLEPYMIINHFQIWRIFTWVLTPPNMNIFFALIMMLFYWQLGRNLESMWGTFRFNLYMFSGFFFTVLGAFVLYGILRLPMVSDFAIIEGSNSVIRLSEFLGGYFSTSYINLSIFLAFAMTIPDMQVLLYFVIPIKMKWLAIVYALIVGYSFVVTGLPGKVAIISSLLNFFIFFASTKAFKGMSINQYRRQRDFRRATQQGRTSPFGQSTGRGGGTTQRQQQETHETNTENRDKSIKIARHRCSVCGRTELTNPELEFRFCSKCNGNYEYCNDHLFTHEHAK